MHFCLRGLDSGCAWAGATGRGRAGATGRGRAGATGRGRAAATGRAWPAATGRKTAHVRVTPYHTQVAKTAPCVRVKHAFNKGDARSAQDKHACVET